MEQFFVNADTMVATKEVEEGVDGNFAVITKADDLIETFGKDKPKLIQLRTNIRGKEAKGDQSKSVKKLAFEIFEQMGKPEKAATEPKVKAAPKVTKVSMARDILKEKGTIKKADLAAAIGHDLQNCHTMISILKNSKRTKDPLFVSYNKTTTEYTLHKTEKEMTEAQDAHVKAAADEKAAAEKKAAEEKAATEKKD